MNYLEQYIINERGVLLNEGVGEYWEDAKGFLVKYGKEFVPEFFGTPKGKKIPWSKIGIRSTLNSSPSNIEDLKASLAKFFSKDNLNFLANQFEKEQTIGDADDFKEVMTPDKFAFFQRSIKRESKTFHRGVHNMVHGRESSAIKYKQADVIDRWKLRLTSAQPGSTYISAGAPGGLAAAGLLGAKLKGVRFLASLSATKFLLLLAGASYVGEKTGFFDIFNDDAKGADEGDIVVRIKKILKEYIKEGDKQYHGEGPYERKKKRYNVGDAETLESSSQESDITDFLVEQLAQRYRMWFMGDMKDKATKAQADGQTAVDWRGHSANTKSKKAAAGKKDAVKKDAVKKDAVKKDAEAEKSATTAAPKLNLSNTSKPSWWDGASMPDDKKLIGKENHYMAALWTPVKSKLGGHKAAAKRTKLAAFNTKRTKAMKMPAGEERTKKLHEIIDARIKEMEGYYATIVGTSGTTQAAAVVPTKAQTAIKAKVKKSPARSTKSATQRQEELLKGTKHVDVKGLQKALLGMGFYDVKPGEEKATLTFKSGEPDGRVGGETKGAIKNLQRVLGFTGGDVDGVYGPTTHSKFLEKKGEVRGSNFVDKSVVTPVAENIYDIVSQEIDNVLRETGRA